MSSWRGDETDVALRQVGVSSRVPEQKGIFEAGSKRAALVDKLRAHRAGKTRAAWLDITRQNGEYLFKFHEETHEGRTQDLQV